jgi:hypothetical protein
MSEHEVVDILGDENGRIDLPALASELAELRMEVSTLRSKNRRLDGILRALGYGDEDCPSHQHLPAHGRSRGVAST